MSKPFHILEFERRLGRELEQHGSFTWKIVGSKFTIAENAICYTKDMWLLVKKVKDQLEFEKLTEHGVSLEELIKYHASQRVGNELSNLWHNKAIELLGEIQEGKKKKGKVRPAKPENSNWENGYGDTHRHPRDPCSDCRHRWKVQDMEPCLSCGELNK